MTEPRYTTAEIGRILTVINNNIQAQSDRMMVMDANLQKVMTSILLGEAERKDTREDVLKLQHTIYGDSAPGVEKDVAMLKQSDSSTRQPILTDIQKIKDKLMEIAADLATMKQTVKVITWVGGFIVGALLTTLVYAFVNLVLSHGTGLIR